MAANYVDEKLRKYEHSLKVKGMKESKVDAEWITNEIVDRVFKMDPRFKLKVLLRGSCYEKLKIEEPDELDIDLAIVDLKKNDVIQVPPGKTFFSVIYRFLNFFR